MARKKFNLQKAFSRGLVNDVTDVVITAGSALTSRKFLSFQRLMPKASPDNFFIKNEPFVKVVGGILAMAFVKQPQLKSLLKGVILDGGIGAVRRLATKKDGTSFFDPIGRGDKGGGLDEPLGQDNDEDVIEIESEVSGPITEGNDEIIIEAGVSGMGQEEPISLEDEF